MNDPYYQDSTSGEYYQWSSQEGFWRKCRDPRHIIYRHDPAANQLYMIPRAANEQQNATTDSTGQYYGAQSNIGSGQPYNTLDSPENSPSANRTQQYTYNRRTSSSNDQYWTAAHQPAPSGHRALPDGNSNNVVYSSFNLSGLSNALPGNGIWNIRNPHAGATAPTPIVPARSRESYGSGSSSADQSVPGLSFFPIPQIPSHRRIQGEENRSLSKLYKVRDNPRYFDFGKLFKVLWHEPAGALSATSVRTDNEESLPPGVSLDRSYGERIFSKPRWFISIRNSSYYCICVPIVTYQQRGVSKPGVNKSEHAVAYTPGNSSEADPSEAPGENEIGMRRSILIEPNRQGDKLERMSRIDYGRLYTIEHNVKIMTFGSVHEHSVRHFWYSYKNVQNPEQDAEEVVNNNNNSGQPAPQRAQSVESDSDKTTRGNRIRAPKKDSSAVAGPSGGYTQQGGYRYRDVSASTSAVQSSGVRRFSVSHENQGQRHSEQEQPYYPDQLPLPPQEQAQPQGENHQSSASRGQRTSGQNRSQHKGSSKGSKKPRP